MSKKPLPKGVRKEIEEARRTKSSSVNLDDNKISGPLPDELVTELGFFGNVSFARSEITDLTEKFGAECSFVTSLNLLGNRLSMLSGGVDHFQPRYPSRLYV